MRKYYLELTLKHVIMIRSVSHVLQAGQMFLTSFDIVLKRSVAIVTVVYLAHCI